METAQNIKTIIFKNAKKAKCYEVRSAKAHGCYAKDELLFRIKTDKIESIIENPSERYAVAI